MFEVAEVYEVMMGRWSQQLALLFIKFASVGRKKLLLKLQDFGRSRTLLGYCQLPT